ARPRSGSWQGGRRPGQAHAPAQIHPLEEHAGVRLRARVLIPMPLAETSRVLELIRRLGGQALRSRFKTPLSCQEGAGNKGKLTIRLSPHGVLKRLLSDDDERVVCDFLRRAAESRLPSSVAAELACAIAESGTSLPTRRFTPLTSVHSTGAPG